jgi:hypothetical protein
MDRREWIKSLLGVIGPLNLRNGRADAKQQLGSSAYRVQSPQLTLSLNEEGEIVGVVLSPGHAKKIARKLSGRTVLAGCTVRQATVRKLAGGAVEFRKTLAGEGDGQSCRLTERFLPTDSGSIRWEIEIVGDGAPSSTPIETHLVWPVTAETRFWTTWGDSRPEKSPGWNDPLDPSAFGKRALYYGGQTIEQSQAISVPIATALDGGEDVGLSLILSPKDVMLELKLTTTPEGEIVFSRSNRRISKDRPVRFTMDLVAHQADWRAGLGWMVAHYPQYFDPPNPLTHEIAGLGAYSEYEGDLDAYKFLSMGFRVNWKAGYDNYYMGMFLPPVGDDVEWVCNRSTTGTPEFPTSISRLRDYSERMRRDGFRVLSYFNACEFGENVPKTSPPPARKAETDRDLWRNPSDYAFYVLRDAIMHSPDGKILGGWEDDVLMDPGEPVYQQYLLEQARRHIEKIPSSAGLCIDELQYLRQYNPQRDDGVTWKDGRAARALVVSWQDLMSKMGPVMRAADKVIYCNPLYQRLDLMRQVDGFYDEFGQVPHSLNGCAFMALRKPYIAWTTNIYDPDPDAYFQRYLYLGAYVSAPVPLDNHAIMPSGAEVDKYYVDYGPMFDALHGRTWVLEPHAIEVEGKKAKANLFAIPGGYLAVVTLAGESTNAKLSLRGLRKLTGQEGFTIETIQPGGTAWMALNGIEKGDLLTLDVPLQRGCAMVRLSYAWIKPESHYFIKALTVTLGTTLRGAQLRYTLDGKEPSLDSLAYTQPFSLNQTTTLKVATFRDGTQTGSVLVAEMVKTRPPAPWIEPFHGNFKDRITVELRQPYRVADTEIRYTLDGCEVTGLSPLYSGPIELTSTTTVRARTFMPGLEPSVTVDGKFPKLPPAAPLPRVHLSDLTPLKSQLADGSAVRKNRSQIDTPLSIGGKKYEWGLGVCSRSEVIYKLEPGYGSFVAEVGLDDAVKNRNVARAAFQVYIRNEREEMLVYETPLLYPGESWPIEAKIPLGSQEIRLATNGSTDWDRVDWVNAGFL